MESGGWAAAHGVGLAETTLHDEHGLLGRAAQTLLVSPIGDGGGGPGFAPEDSPPQPSRRVSRRPRTRTTSAACSSNSPLRNTSAAGRPASGGRRSPRLRSTRTEIVRRPPAVSIVTRSDAAPLECRRAATSSDWIRRELGCLPARRRSDASTRSVIGRAKPSGNLACSTRGLHDFAQRRTLERVALQAAARARRVARPVHPFERRREQLVLVGIGEELDFVDGRHGGGHGTGRRRIADN